MNDNMPHFALFTYERAVHKTMIQIFNSSRYFWGVLYIAPTAVAYIYFGNISFFPSELISPMRVSTYCGVRVGGLHLGHRPPHLSGLRHGHFVQRLGEAGRADVARDEDLNPRRIGAVLCRVACIPGHHRQLVGGNG